MDLLPALLVPAGTAVTPNYVDNASARVAPWCNCGASGNRREECEAFRQLFTRNHCLGEGPGLGGAGVGLAFTALYQAAWQAGGYCRGEETEAFCGSQVAPLRPLLSSCPFGNLRSAVSGEQVSDQSGFLGVCGQVPLWAGEDLEWN